MGRMEEEKVSFSYFNCGHFKRNLLKLIKILLNFFKLPAIYNMNFITEIFTENKPSCFESMFVRLLWTGQGPLAEINAPLVYITPCTLNQYKSFKEFS